jgi:hypothetical protein
MTTRTRLLGAIGVSLWSVVAAGQGTPAALPAALVAHVKDDRWNLVSSVRGLPLGVREELQTLFGTMTLDIAEPGGGVQSGGTAADATPVRRLIAAGCSYEYCLVYYERGGGARTWLVALFHWTPDASRFEWGGRAPGGLKTIDDVRQAVLSGAIRSSNNTW